MVAHWIFTFINLQNGLNTSDKDSLPIIYLTFF